MWLGLWTAVNRGDRRARSCVPSIAGWHVVNCWCADWRSPRAHKVLTATSTAHVDRTGNSFGSRNRGPTWRTDVRSPTWPASHARSPPRHEVAETAMSHPGTAPLRSRTVRGSRAAHSAKSLIYHKMAVRSRVRLEGVPARPQSPIALMITRFFRWPSHSP